MRALVFLSAVCACAPAATVCPQAPAPPATASVAAPDEPIEVAVTIDDLPRHGTDIPDLSRVAIHQSILAAIAKHNVPRVYGFVNGSKLRAHPEDRAALEAWRAAGHPLGNHTASHFDPNKVPLDQYLADIDAGESFLRELGAPERELKVFRYPFLREGSDLAQRAKIRDHLASRGYRIAQVTIDFYDWAYNDAYARCLAKKDERALAALRTTYMDDAVVFLRWSVRAARDLFGRAIKHVLLLHVGAFDAVVLDEMFAAYEKAGVRWITLDDALTDPLYASEPAAPKSTGGNWLNQVRRARDAKIAPQPSPPDELLDALCR